jgi:hypothetical protein
MTFFIEKSGPSTLRVLRHFLAQGVPPPEGTATIRAGNIVPCPPLPKQSYIDKI